MRPGSKGRYLENLDWLSGIAPVSYCFANTADGCKLLYEDGVFCEFAVFTEGELAGAVFSPGMVVWKADGVPDRIAVPKVIPSLAPARSVE